MAHVERVRDPLSELPTSEEMEERVAQGWRPVAIEWKRELPAGQGQPDQLKQEVPYGLRVSPDCLHLEDHPSERETLKLMMTLLVSERHLSEVAAELNRQGSRMRSGGPWTQTAVYNMLPRLIEVGPRIL